MELHATLSPPACLGLILDGLMRAIAAKIADYPFTGAMVTYLWKRVNTVKNRFFALAALIAAGKIPRERQAKPRARKSPNRVGAAEKINWRKWLPMGRFGYLCRIMPSETNRFGAAQFSGQLCHLLGQPEMRALLAATPKAARLLAPLCFMLGIEASLLRPVRAAPPLPAPASEIVTSKNAAFETGAAALDDAGTLSPQEDARPRAPEPPSEPGAAFFVPV